MTEPTQTTTPTPTPKPAGNGQSVLEGGAPTPYEWIDESFRVFKEDKSLDLEASAKKVSGSYRELKQRMVGGEAPPKDAEGYEVKEELPGGLKFEEFRKDPKFGARLKEFHAVGMSNKQLTKVMHAFSEFLLGEADASSEDCRAELGKHWTTDGEWETNNKASYRAAQAIANKAGLDPTTVTRKYGNDPDFIRLMAAIGREMKEDVAPSPNAMSVTPGDFETQVAALDARLMTLTPMEEKLRRGLIDQKMALYEQKYGRKPAGPVTG